MDNLLKTIKGKLETLRNEVYFNGDVPALEFCIKSGELQEIRKLIDKLKCKLSYYHPQNEKFKELAGCLGSDIRVGSFITHQSRQFRDGLKDETEVDIYYYLPVIYALAELSGGARWGGGLGRKSSALYVLWYLFDYGVRNLDKLVF